MKLCLLFSSITLTACATAVLEPAEPAASDAGKKEAASDAKPPPPKEHDAAIAFDSGAEPPDAGGPCSLMINYGSGGCQSCMQACCAEDNACVASQDCVGVITCLNGCQPNDSSCVSACQGKHPQGWKLFGAISQCMNTQCNNACP